MQDQVFTYGGTMLSFSTAGNGPRALLAFHGFGQDRHVFKELSEKFSGHYTLYVFDLYFHGTSQWNKGEQPLERPFWKELLTEFLVQHRIEKFDLLGFSMGGKFALATLEAFPEKTGKAFLLAPDGIKTSMWYSLATYPLFLRNFFKSMIMKPQRFHAIANTAFKLGLIDKGILRFTESQMNTTEKRERVYYSWVVFRHLKFNVDLLAEQIVSHNIEMTIVVGRHDKIITAGNMKRLLKKVMTARLEILETGHNGLISTWAESLPDAKVISNAERNGQRL